jgi:hypothetical protein
MYWKIQLPTGEFLDDSPDFSFELNNQVFSTNDTSVLPGSFSFPSKINLTDRNKVLLGNPHLVNNANAFKKYEGCWVYCYNHALFYCTLTITSANKKTADINLVANPMAKLKESYLSDIDLGGMRSLPTPLINHMKTVAISPSDYDYAWLPMFIFNRLNEPGGEQLKFHNYYDTGTNAFHLGSYALTPSVRLDYLLKRIITIEDTGYQFINAWQTETELKRLYIYNNRDVRTSDTDNDPDVPATFDLRDHLPKVKTVELLKSIIGLFNLGLFSNPFSRTIRLNALANLLKRAAKHDWSKYAIDDPVVEPEQSAPNFYTFPGEPPGAATLEAIPTEWPNPEDCIFVETEEKYNDLYNNAGSIGKYFYIETKMWMTYVAGFASGTTFGPVKYCHRGLVLDTARDKPYQLSFTPVFSSGNWGDVSRWIPDPNAAGKWIFDYHEVSSLGLIPYRGMVDGVSGPTTSQSGWKPTITNQRMDITENNAVVASSKYSMNWYGPYGIYNQWHAQWNEMLRNGRPVTQSFIIPISALTAFSFEDKVWSGGMEYFIKRIRIKKATGKSMLLIDVSMVPTI